MISVFLMKKLFARSSAEAKCAGFTFKLLPIIFLVEFLLIFSTFFYFCGIEALLFE